MRLIVVVLVVLLAACGPPRNVVTARALVDDPLAHDGGQIVLVGTAENPRVRTPDRGNTYTLFAVADGTARVPVVVWGTQPVGAGDTVEVRGTFRARVQAGTDLVPDAVEAKFVGILRAAAHPPGTPVSPP